MAKRMSFLLIPFLLIASSLSGYAQSDILTTRNLFDIHLVLETAISPDGNYVACTVFSPRPFSEAAGPDYRDLYVYDIKRESWRRFLSGKRSIHSPSWTPDGNTITFLGMLESGKPMQVYGMRLDGGEATSLAAAATGISRYQLSPDGKQIAYTATASLPTEYAEARKLGFDAQIYEESSPDLNLYIHDPANGNTRRVTEGVAVFDFTWNNDGKTIAAAVAEKNLVDHSYMFKRIHLIDVASGTMRLFVENPGKLGKMVWSPDGKKLAFIAGVAAWDSKDGSIFVAEPGSPKKFDELRNYSEGFEGTVIDVNWKDNATLLFASEEGVDITLREQKLNAASSSLVIKPGTIVFSRFSRAANTISFAASTPRHPMELYTLTGGNLQRRTTLNPWIENIRLAKQESFTYKAKDGLEIASILIYPLDYTPGTRYPLIVDIHGGPEACYKNGWVSGYGNWGQVAAARGYFVFMPNYRASTGRGVEFAKMGLGDLAGKEFDDVLDGIDHLIDMGFVDADRVGMGGGSYGGYFSAWAATKHSKRFAGAVVFVGVSNQISKRNTTDIPWEDYLVHWDIWTYEDYEKVYDRSPVKWALGSTTPTLILHGTEDPRVHPSQSLELYRTLKLHGKAPVRLIWYPGEGHGNRKNTSRLDYLVRTMDWFDTFVKNKGTKMPSALPTYPLD